MLFYSYPHFIIFIWRLQGLLRRLSMGVRLKLLDIMVLLLRMLVKDAFKALGIERWRDNRAFNHLT
jgi:hypothetical protein